MAQQVEFLIAGVRDSSGNPLASGKVYFFDAGTTNAKTIWTDSAKAGEAAHPLVLDARGSAEVFAEGFYDIRIDTADDVTIATRDAQLFRETLGTGAHTTNYNTSSSTVPSQAFFESFAPDGALFSLGSIVEVVHAFDIFNNFSGTNSVTIEVKFDNGPVETTLATFTLTNIPQTANQSVGVLRTMLFNRIENMSHFSELTLGDNSVANADTGTGIASAYHQVCHGHFELLEGATSPSYGIKNWFTLSDSSANFSYRSRGGFLRALT